jgi:hypothetical protein
MKGIAMKWMDATEADLNGALTAVKYGHDGSW